MLSWQELDRQFQELSRPLRDARLDIQWGAAGEYFNLAAYFDVQAKHRFDALSRLAGEKLLSCLPADSDTHKEIRNEPNPVFRWWKALWHLSPDFEHKIVGFQKSATGEDMGTIYSGSINNPAASSASLALELLAIYGEGARMEKSSDANPGGLWQRIKSSINLRPGLFGVSIDLKKLLSQGSSVTDPQLVSSRDSPEENTYDEKVRQADRTVFLRLNAIADEALVDDLLNYRICTGTLRLEEKRLIEEMVVQLRRIENRFLDLEIRKRAEELAEDLDAVWSIVVRTFFGVGNERLKFYPSLINPEVYDKELRELNDKLGCAWKAYASYRKAVKERLMV